MNAWASTIPRAGEVIVCVECAELIPLDEEYYYVTERAKNDPVCWRHIERESGPARKVTAHE